VGGPENSSLGLGTAVAGVSVEGVMLRKRREKREEDASKEDWGVRR
jgi:hypothetical protein